MKTKKQLYGFIKDNRGNLFLTKIKKPVIKLNLIKQNGGNQQWH